MCVVDMFAQIDCDVVHPATIPVFFLFSGVSLHESVAPNTAALSGFCNALLHFP